MRAEFVDKAARLAHVWHLSFIKDQSDLCAPDVQHTGFLSEQLPPLSLTLNLKLD